MTMHTGRDTTSWLPRYRSAASTSLNWCRILPVLGQATISAVEAAVAGAAFDAQGLHVDELRTTAHPGPGSSRRDDALHRIYVPYTTTQRPFPFFIAVCVRAYTPHCPKICRGRRKFKVCLPPPLRGIGSATPALRTLPYHAVLRAGARDPRGGVQCPGAGLPAGGTEPPLAKTDARLQVAPSRVGASLRSMNSDSFSHG